jgi:hypothetical protein
MTSDRLREILSSFGAERVDGDWLAVCPLCEKERKVILSPGVQYPCLVTCRRCAVPGDREGNRRLSRAICDGVGVDFGELCELMPADEIRELWAEVGGDQRQSQTRSPAADPDTLHSVYGSLLHWLGLTDVHERWLEKQGLTDAHRIRYRSAPDEKSRIAVTEYLTASYGIDVLVRVPGFDAGGRLLTRYPAILIPCRDTAGRIVAIKQRLTGASKSGRMRLLSSAPVGGPHAISTVHVPYGVGGQQHQTVWVTEGERKADVVWSRLGHPVVALPGASQWRQLVSVLSSVVVDRGSVVLALDLDDAGERATRGLYQVLTTAGYSVSVAVWSDGKGIDDAVANGVTVELSEYEDDSTIEPPHQTRTGKRNYIADPVAYLRQHGPQLRDGMDCHQNTLSKLIASGEIGMVKSKRGQCVFWPGDPIERVGGFLAEINSVSQADHAR